MTYGKCSRLHYFYRWDPVKKKVGKKRETATLWGGWMPLYGICHSIHLLHTSQGLNRFSLPIHYSLWVTDALNGCQIVTSVTYRLECQLFKGWILKKLPMYHLWWWTPRWSICLSLRLTYKSGFCPKLQCEPSLTSPGPKGHLFCNLFNWWLPTLTTPVTLSRTYILALRDTARY